MPPILVKKEVAWLTRESESNVDRLVRQTRLGEKNFPLPISPPYAKCKWRREDLARYLSSQHNRAPPDNAETPNPNISGANQQRRDCEWEARQNEEAKRIQFYKEQRTRHSSRSK
jgi:hypothetical protein